MNYFDSNQNTTIENDVPNTIGSERFLFDDLTDDVIGKIRPHVINLVQGRFSVLSLNCLES